MKPQADNAREEDFKIACKALFPNYIKNVKTGKCYVLDPYKIYNGSYRISYITPKENYLISVFDGNSIDCIKYFNKELEKIKICLVESYEEISEKEYDQFVFPNDYRRDKHETTN